LDQKTAITTFNKIWELYKYLQPISDVSEKLREKLINGKESRLSYESSIDYFA